MYVALKSIDERLKRFHIRVLFDVINESLGQMSCAYKVARSSIFIPFLIVLVGLFRPSLRKMSLK